MLWRKLTRAMVAIAGGFYDFGGIVLDAGNRGRTGKLFVVTPRNIQNDTIIDDATCQPVIG